jgi:hypothetical protein
MLGIRRRPGARRAGAVAACAAALVLGGSPSSPAGRASPCDEGSRRLAVAGWVAPAHGSVAPPNRAGLVVDDGDGRVHRFCISFAEDEITGYELLRRSGLALSVQDYGGGNVAVCRIGDVGCTYPREPCFCRCQSPSASSCRFWGYYTMDRRTGAWVLSPVGAGARRVRDGDVDGWRWGNHQRPNPPPSTTLAALCAAGSAVGPAASPSPSPATGPGSGSAPTGRPAAGPAPAGSGRPRSGAPEGASAPSPSSPSSAVPATAVASPPAPRAAATRTGGTSGPGAVGLVAVLAVAGALGGFGAFRARRRRP